MLQNTRDRYGAFSILSHWVIAIVVIVQFAMGLYMLSLDYNNTLYHTLPGIHEAIGIFFTALLVARIIWRFVATQPQHLASIKPWEHQISRIVQTVMDLLLLGIVISGYLISSAGDTSISVFGWFDVPATVQFKKQASEAGWWHYWLAMGVIALAGLHALAAFKHHFIDKDKTLLRMIGKP